MGKDSRLHVDNAFQRIFGADDYLKLQRGEKISGVHLNSKGKWGISWNGHKVKYNAKVSVIMPPALGFFCAFSEKLMLNRMVSHAPTGAHSRVIKSVKLNKQSFTEIRSAYAAVLCGLCELEECHGELFLIPRTAPIDHGVISRFELLMSCSVDRLIYEFWLAGQPLPESFLETVLVRSAIHKILSQGGEEFFVDQTHEKTTSETHSRDKKTFKSKRDTYKLAGQQVKEILTELGVESSADLDQNKLIKFKRELDRCTEHRSGVAGGGSTIPDLSSSQTTVKNAVANRKSEIPVFMSLGSPQVFPSVGQQTSLTATPSMIAEFKGNFIAPKPLLDKPKAVDVSCFLDVNDVWYCEQVGAQLNRQFAQSAINFALSIKRWASRNKRIFLFNVVDIAICSIISAAISGGIFAPIYILASICTIIFWAIVDGCVVLGKTIWHTRKMKGIEGKCADGDTRNRVEWKGETPEEDAQAVDDLKQVLKSQTFFSSSAGYTGMFNQLLNYKNIQEKVVAAKGVAGESVENAVRYQRLLGQLKEQEGAFNRAGDSVEKLMVANVQAFTQVTSESDQLLETLWSAMPEDEDQMRALFLSSLEHVDEEATDPIWKRAKKFIFGSTTANLVRQHLNDCGFDYEEAIREISSGVPLHDLIESKNAKNAIVENKLAMGGMDLSRKLWGLFQYGKDIEPPQKHTKKRFISKQAEAHLKDGGGYVVSVVKAYVVYYIKRIPHRIHETVVEGLLRRKANILGSVPKKTVPNPFSEFGLGIVLWAAFSLFYSFINSKNDEINDISVKKRQKHSNGVRFDEGFDDEDEQVAELSTQELRALRRQAKGGSEVVLEQLNAILKVKSKLESLAKMVQSGEHNPSLQGEIAKTLISYQLLKHAAECNLENTSGVGYQELLRYKELLKKRATTDYF